MLTNHLILLANQNSLIIKIEPQKLLILLTYKSSLNPNYRHLISRQIETTIKSHLPQMDNLNLPSLQPLILFLKQKFQEIDDIAVLDIKLSQKEAEVRFAGQGRLAVWLSKAGKAHLFKLNNLEIKGKLINNDYLLIGSFDFFPIWNQERRLTLFNHLKSNQELIQKMIDSQPKISACALGLVIENPEPEKLISQAPPFSAASHRPAFKTQLELKQDSQIKFAQKKRQLALVAAFIFLILLGISVGLGVKKRQQLNDQLKQTQLKEDVLYRLDQAKSLKNLNPLRAKSLLGEAKDIFAKYQAEDILSGELRQLEQNVVDAYAEIAKEFYITNPELYYDLNLVKEGFVPTQLSLSAEDLSLLDENSQTLVVVNLKTKAAMVLAGQDLIPDSPKLASIAAWVFLASPSSLQILDKETKQQLHSFKFSTIKADYLVGYANNVYILDKNLGQVYRLRGTQDGLNKPEPFFETAQDLIQVSGLAIDGSVWLLYQDGGLEKYTLGLRDAYYPAYGLDKPITQAEGLYTDENLDAIYVLDRDNSRVVAVSKKGEYQGQYMYDGFRQAIGFVVLKEIGKLLVVQDNKIYGIDLK